MKIPLNQFEQYIDEIILKRGVTYFEQGLGTGARIAKDNSAKRINEVCRRETISENIKVKTTF